MKNTLLFCTLATPLGAMRAMASVQGLCLLEFSDSPAPGLRRAQQQVEALRGGPAQPGKNAVLEQTEQELAQYFAEIYGSELSGERTNKGDLIAYILEQEQLLAAECLMVGDREFDILGARRNGIGSIGVAYGYGSVEELAQAQPEMVIQSFGALLEAIPGLGCKPA